MMRYYLSLKDEITAFILDNYEFRTASQDVLQGAETLEYRRKSSGTGWLSVDCFGKKERNTIAESQTFKPFEARIKSYFPYRLFNDLVKDLWYQRMAVAS